MSATGEDFNHNFKMGWPLANLNPQFGWCGHCKKMKPQWDELMALYADSPTALVADVDCTAEGKALCAKNGVRGYPTIKYGEVDDLQKYAGGRDLESLKKHAEEHLKPKCGPFAIDLCGDIEKAAIEKFQSMAPADLEAAISEKEEAVSALEKDYKAAAKELEAQQNKLKQDKEDAVAAIKDSGLVLMKQVKIHADKNAAKDEL